MLNALAGAVVAVLFFAAVIVGGVWNLAAAYPVAFAVTAPLAVLLAVRLEMRARKLKRDAIDQRLRDEHVPSMSPVEYEQFTARQLERTGWKVRHVGQQGDQGCDVVAELRGFRAVIQAKHYRVKVGNSAVQEIAAARRFYDAHVMAVVAPNGFTAAAQALAESNGVHLLHHSALPTLEALARIP